jgi:hypothetical protein
MTKNDAPVGGLVANFGKRNRSLPIVYAKFTVSERGCEWEFSARDYV